MIIDLSMLNNNLKSKIDINESNIPFDLTGSGIIRLENINFCGIIKRLVDDSIELDGIVKGVMVLPDDITLEEVNHKFEVKIEENLENIQNTLDILPILWENILVEITSKVRSSKTADIKLEGDGWRVISEEELEKEKLSNSPFKDLDKLIGKER